MGREAKGLLPSEGENTEASEARVKQPMNPFLERLVEIDHHVPAQYDVEVVEGAVRHQIVRGEHDVLAEQRTKQRVVAACRVVLGEGLLAAGSLIVRSVFLHRGEREQAGSCSIKRGLADVCGIDSAPLIEAFLMKKDGHRVNFFARGTAGVPDSNERVG